MFRGNVQDTLVYLENINLILGPELQCLLRVKKDLSIDFSGCEKLRLKLIKIKIVSIFLKITMISLTTNTTSIRAIYLALNIAC